MGKPRQQRKVRLDFRAAPFGKRADKPAPVYNKARKWLQQSTGICLGRCDWTGTLRVICTEAQYGRMVMLAREDAELHALLKETPTTYEEGVTTFYARGLNDEEKDHG